MKRLIYLVLFCLAASAAAQEQSKVEYPIIRIKKNDMDKIYRVLYSDIEERIIVVEIKDNRGTPLKQDTLMGKSFSKAYELTSLRNGEYSINVTYGARTFSEKILLRSQKDIIEEKVEKSITLENDYPNLYISVTEIAMQPMNIFFYSPEEKFLKMFYWEPSEEFSTRKIDLSQFEGFEVKIQIVQDGEDKLIQLLNLY